MSNIIKVDNPSSSQIKFSPEENQMFGLSIRGFYPNDSPRYFNIDAFVSGYKFEDLQTTRVHINLVPCSSDHFKGFEKSMFMNNLDFMFCPELGF